MITRIIEAKSTLLFIVLLAAVGAICTTATNAFFFEGSGTENDPYLIKDAEDLRLLSEYVNMGEPFGGIYFLQTADIDLEGEEWTPIGLFESGNYFFGIYDGGGHVIRNLVTPQMGNNGFFGMLGGTVANLGIESGVIFGEYVGAISSDAVDSNALIINCYSKAIVMGKYRSGGIADNFDGSIINCWSDCDYLSSDCTGGITSYNAMLVEGCFSNSELINGNFTGNMKMSAKLSKKLLQSESLCDMLNSELPAYLRKYEFVNQLIPWKTDKAGLCFDKEKKVDRSSPVENSNRGTVENPYIIDHADDLLLLRDMVNGGVDFSDTYFLQTGDIDLSGEEWIPIGIFESGKYFFGTYDGGGHIISNLVTQKTGNNGFFGMLGGTVVNLGIESGCIYGDYIGSIASHAACTEAQIINCYNKADLIGKYRAGGIADNFAGKIVNCWSSCSITSEQTGGIVSYNAQYINNCYSTYDIIPHTFSGVKKNSISYNIRAVKSDQPWKKLNAGLVYCAPYFKEGINLAKWTEGQQFSGEYFSLKSVSPLLLIEAYSFQFVIVLLVLTSIMMLLLFNYVLLKRRSGSKNGNDFEKSA